MAPQKRRVLVAFESDAAGGDHKRQRKLAVSIESTATNAELAREIAATLNESSVTLEISGGFELRDQDGIDMIAENDIVTARVSSEVYSAPPIAKTEYEPDILMDSTELGASSSRDEVAGIKISFVTAALARAHAKSTPRDQSEPTNGVPAFGGQLVDGNTTLRMLEHEAARVLEWESPELMQMDDFECDRDDGGVCSCSIAQEVEQYGLSSTLHCRLKIDGSACKKAACPYSHVKLSTPKSDSCSICAEALVSPCPKCSLSGSDAQCPLVQNAGCGHLHHAHCVGARRARSGGCPSGCTLAKYPREAAVLDRKEEHIIVVWNGDRIDSVPISLSVSREPLVTMSTDAVVSLVEKFLEQQNFARSGLSLRIHSRDPVPETVSFTQSTLVSVCPTSRHSHMGSRRFALFTTKSAEEKKLPPPSPLAIDLHTSHGPIVACGCTLLKDLFPATEMILLYAVKRRTEVVAEAPSEEREVVSKQSMYVADAAWHPSVPQTPRGIAALLSSLYLLAHSVAQTGIAGEQKVLALAYALFRFPPAVITLAALFLNKVPRPEEKSALAEALYHALGEFSSRGPSAIVTRETRRFETVRILLAYIAGAASAPSVAQPRRPVDEVPLVCPLSQKRLADPVMLGTAIVERTVAQLYESGGQLFHCAKALGDATAVAAEASETIRELLVRSRGMRSDSTLVLRVDDIGAPPPSFMATLDTAARDFIQAIRRANQSDLVTRGPLELKSADVVPPQIVLDQEGLLAVFTGRGCGTARDVNFFRPTNGGDTEVDVNDVSYALEKVVLTRKLEDTWQIDSFGEVSAISRPPDEAIVLCLDLSQSMNQRSGVSDAGHARHDESHDGFNVELESEKLVDKITGHLTRQEIMNHAQAHLRAQHASCHHPWWILLHSEPDDSDGDEDEVKELLVHLANIASREALRLSLKNSGEDTDDDDSCDEDIYGDPVEPVSRTQSGPMLQMLCFAAAVANNDMARELAHSLNNILRDASSSIAGVEPFDVPRALLDPRTGELLLDPVRPSNAPKKTFVNAASRVWFEVQGAWPRGYSAQHESAAKLKKSVTTWIAGTDILPKLKGDTISVTLRHTNKNHTWTLLPQTPVKTLYALVNRATGAAYEKFVLRMCNSKALVKLGDGLLIGESGSLLERGGSIEVTQYKRHTRKSYEVLVDDQMFLMSQDSTMLALMSYVTLGHCGLSDLNIWYGLTDSGDGLKTGEVAKSHEPLSKFRSVMTDTIVLGSDKWRWNSTYGQRTREDSKNLSRLQLLTELFNVFLNRAGSFDTSVSLVLGLVTFSDMPSVEQELTPIFEKFRERLETVYAEGDTAVYDALDSARGLLTTYRTDLPNLRKRIIIVSDGEDTSSSTLAWQACAALQRSHIVIDSVQVGSRSDPVLHAISVATGGYRFSPRTSLADALSIFDLETMLYSGERPFRAARPLVKSGRELNTYQSFLAYPIDVITVDEFPKRAEHRRLNQRVKTAATSLGKVGGGGDERMKRIMREIKSVVADPHPNIDVYVNDRDMSFLKVILEAPKDATCPYNGGTFLLSVDLPVGYPRDPPEVRFVTFILHPNVSKQGKVCIAELGRLWSSDITLKEIFSLIYGILLTPDLENPLEIQASLKYYDDDGTYALAVTDAVRKHASKSRAEWQEELDE